MPLLEIIKTDKTADWVIATCFDVGVQKNGNSCERRTWFILRILAPLMNEAQLMLDEGGDILREKLAFLTELSSQVRNGLTWIL